MTSEAGLAYLVAIRSLIDIRHVTLRISALPSLRRRDAAQRAGSRLHRPARRRARTRRRDPRLADAAGRRRQERRRLQGGAARALRGDQHPFGREARRDRGLADLRHPARHRRTGLEGQYRGQTQKWFALRFTGEESEIDISLPGRPRAGIHRLALGGHAQASGARGPVQTQSLRAGGEGIREVRPR